MSVSPDRIQIVLPAPEQALADAISERLGGGGRSAAIRYALREAARQMGIAGQEKSPGVAKSRPRKKPT